MNSQDLAWVITVGVIAVTWAAVAIVRAIYGKGDEADQ